ncbi:MAG: 6-carboxytetrahydropterin synthase [Tannerellaceae bacterium]|jgi:6-pyruvoyltetrahydropterin/6-carboxytetrahydropterin synthase|nr:6-carboxytetrahydropterin synthase [Tannerellaceae bacterium]
MIIRKKFSYEGSHVVRNCASRRCSHSIHGHSAIVELMFYASELDNAGMVMDFGLMGALKQIVDSFDHTHDMWNKESEKILDFFKEENERWVILPFNPTAEMLSLMFFAYAKHIIEHTVFNNGEGEIEIMAVRYHETDTGYAEAGREDFEHIWMPRYSLNDIIFSEGIRSEWPEAFEDVLMNNKKIVNPDIPLQIEL